MIDVSLNADSTVSVSRANTTGRNSGVVTRQKIPLMPGPPTLRLPSEPVVTIPEIKGIALLTPFYSNA